MTIHRPPGRRRALLAAAGLLILLLAAGALGRPLWPRLTAPQRLAGGAAPTASPPTPPLAATATPTGVDPTATATRPTATLEATPTALSADAATATEVAPPPTAVLLTATSAATRTPVATATVLATASATAAAPSPSPTPLPPRPAAAPVRMVVPAIGLDIPVVEVRWKVEQQNGVPVSVWETASYAAGHLFTSANLGAPGNVVLSGHHNIEGQVFRDISTIGEPGSRLSVGTEITLFAADGRAFVYRIVEWHRFREAGASDEERLAHERFLEPTAQPMLTLVTCWPYASNTHRVVVIAAWVGP